MNKSALVVPYCFFFLVGFSVPCIATAEVSALVNAENQAVVTDGLGVELRFDRAGNLLSVKSTYSHPVEFRDRRGINKAYLIAEEKAKGNIARYLNQVVTSTRTVSEIDESLSKSARTRGSSGELWSKDNTRSVTESIREITSSSASAILKGVRILENRYDPKAEEVTVVVGVNRESLAGANQLGRGLSGSSNLNGEQAGGGSFPSAGAETRRSRDAERF